jgi:hypothetical protein
MGAVTGAIGDVRTQAGNEICACGSGIRRGTQPLLAFVPDGS